MSISTFKTTDPPTAIRAGVHAGATPVDALADGELPPCLLSQPQALSPTPGDLHAETQWYFPMFPQTQWYMKYISNTIGFGEIWENWV
jgi:hypothetical protein